MVCVSSIRPDKQTSPLLAGIMDFNNNTHCVNLRPEDKHNNSNNNA